MTDNRIRWPFIGGLLSASALTTTLLLAPTAFAGGLPHGGHYVNGHGSIGKAGQSLTVKQSSTTGIIDWNNFSIGEKSSVGFDNGSGATLNRVTGGNLSRIAGVLHATGSLYLMNSQGVIVSGTGRVVTGGSFVASSGDIESDAFSRLRLANATAAVVNRGSIVASSVTLAGKAVRNSGSISAAQVNLQGRDRLVAGGTIAAQNRDGSGGTIVATARKIDVTGSLSASGTRGGTILIGGDIHGGAIAADNFVKQTVADAGRTKIAAGARIAADGTEGSGGHIVVWSDGRTTFEGAISAKGRTSGGFAEVSSHKLLGFAGTVDLTSSAGKTGTLLLDPEDVTISDAADSTDTCTAGTCTATGDDSNINVTTLEGALAAANVVVNTGSSGAQSGDITVLDPVTWSNGSILTLDAFHSVAIDASIAITGAGGLKIRTNDGGVGGRYSFNDGGSVAFTDVIGGITQGTLQINTRSYELVNSVVQLANDVFGDVSGNYALANDYDATADGTYTEAPVTDLAGHFEGLGNTISNLTVNDSASAVTGGLFAWTEGVVRDINLSNVSVTASGAVWVGGLVGDNDGGKVKWSSVSGTVSMSGSPSDSAVGGLVGVNGGAVRISTSSANIEEDGDDLDVGGLVGENDGVIGSSQASGTVTADGDQSYAGDLVGYGGIASLVQYSSANGNVSDSGQSAAVGGLIGYGDEASRIEYSSASGNVSGTGVDSGVGGLVGVSEAFIVGSYYETGTVSGDAVAAGGLVGVQEDGEIKDSSAGGVVTIVSGTAGGLIGDDGDSVVLNSSSSADVSLTGTSSGDAGGLIGDAFDVLVLKSFATGDVDGGTDGYDIGGLVGFSDFVSVIKSSYATGTVSADGDIAIGGLVGENEGLIDRSYSTSNVSGDVLKRNRSAAVGGLVGYNDDGLVRKSSASGTVTGGGRSSAVGGLVGDNAGWIALSSASSNVSATSAADADVGGLVGSNETLITKSYSTGTVSGGNLSNSGGFAGWSDGLIAFSYSTGAVTAGDGSWAGGFIGWNDGEIRRDYSTGDAEAGQASVVGGLAGANDGVIHQTYSTGTVGGQSGDFLGGLVGYDNSASGSIEHSYWDTQTSGIADKSQGAGNIANDAGIKGKKTAALQAALPAGFNPTFWAIDLGINNGLPYLIALTSSY